MAAPLDTYTLRQADRALILAQRLLEEVTHAPEIEEDMALISYLCTSRSNYGRLLRRVLNTLESAA